MTAKQYLSRIKYLTAQIDALNKQKKKLYRDNLPTENKDLEKAYDNLVKKIDTQKIALLVLKTQILTTIEKIPDAHLRVIIIKRYINLENWDDIADSIHYCDKWTRTKLHRQALEEVEKIINNQST